MSDEEIVIPDLEYESLNTIIDQFNTINDSLTLFKMQINGLQQKVKSVEKSVKKELKKIKKDKEKSKPKNKRAPSGFAKPTKVTKELCDFLEKPEGFEIARTEVSKMLVKYIQTNNLLENNNKIVPDEKLKSLLGIQGDNLDNLNYFNIQKYMNKHFYSNKTNPTNINV
jgi:chromatin remodeling complex protein RSC6